MRDRDYPIRRTWRQSTFRRVCALPTCLSASSFVHEVNYELFLLGTRYRELKFELRLEGNGGERGESLDKNGINKEGNTADGVD